MYNMNDNMYGYAPPPRLEIKKVNGEAGARSFRMAPNSSVFLADTNDSSRIWVVITDDAGYPTVTALDVTIHQEAPPPDYNGLEERIKKMEGMVNELYSRFDKQSNKKQQQQQQQ